MEAETHPDPLREAMAHGLQRAMQVASFAGTAAQVCIYHQKTQARAAAERDARARRALQAQIRAEREAARAGWSSALDPQWLREADLSDTAQAWGAAMPYADRNVPWYEPTAAAAMRKSEERLRDLHPFAMARYDRLRAESLGPAEAMRDAAPLFALSPRARAWPYTPVPSLDVGVGAGAARVSDPPALGSDPADMPGTEALESRGRGIVTALQERAVAAGREPLGHDELQTVLEAVTNLPADVIDSVTQPAPANGPALTGLDGTAAPGHGRAADTGEFTGLKAGLISRTTRPWQRDFPVPIGEVVAAAAAGPPRTTAAPGTTTRPAARRAARPRGPGHA